MKRQSVGWVMEWKQSGLGKRRWLAAAQGKNKQVYICKLKVIGEDWLLPNIQSRKLLAFAAPEEEEKVLSKSLRVLCRVSSDSTDWMQNHSSAGLSLCDPQENASYLPMTPLFQHSLYSSGGVLAEDKALYVLFFNAVSKYSDCKGCCFHPGRADVHVYFLCDCARQKACSVWV